MQGPLPLEYISRLIEGGYYADAQRGLTSILEADPANAAAWALTAWVAPDSAQCDQALQGVINTSQDARLTAWAKRGLLLIEHTGALDEQAPPVLSRAMPAASELMQQPKAPEVRGPGYNISQAGGGIMIAGTVVMALAIAIRPFADFMTSTGIGAGGCGFGLIAIGAVVAFIGYQRKAS